MKVYEYCKRMSIHWITYLEHISDTEMSWQHWPKNEVKVWWTIGMMNRQEDYPTQTVTDMEWRKCHVQERLATIRNSAHFSQIFLSHMSTSTSLFFNKLEEDNIFLIYNSTIWVNNVSLFNNLTSLPMNETRFLPWLISLSLFCVLTSLTTVIAQSFFIFRESEKEDERELQKYLFVNLSLRSEKV